MGYSEFDLLVVPCDHKTKQRNPIFSKSAIKIMKAIDLAKKDVVAKQLLAISISTKIPHWCLFIKIIKSGGFGTLLEGSLHSLNIMQAYSILFNFFKNLL